jgi:hypothetical protein
LVVPRWEQTILGKRGPPCHMYYVMDNIYVMQEGWEYHLNAFWAQTGNATGPLESLVLALALAAAAGLPIAAQGPPGYYLVQGPELPDSLVEVSGDGRFVISVRREAATRDEARLIARAESLYPDPALIEREVARFLADPRNQGRVWEERHREAAAEPGPRWWWLVDHPWWPFAVTAGAVEHYVEAARRLRDSPDPGVPLGPISDILRDSSTGQGLLRATPGTSSTCR